MMLPENFKPEVLEKIRLEHLEAEIIALIADKLHIEVRDAMDLYYASELSSQIGEGLFGIQYLDASYLVEDLLMYEPHLTRASS
jgi:hypothetical protein